MELVEDEKKQILLQLEETLTRYEPKKENLIPILQQIQKSIKIFENKRTCLIQII